MHANTPKIKLSAQHDKNSLKRLKQCENNSLMSKVCETSVPTRDGVRVLGSPSAARLLVASRRNCRRPRREVGVGPGSACRADALQILQDQTLCLVKEAETPQRAQSQRKKKLSVPVSPKQWGVVFAKCVSSGVPCISINVVRPCTRFLGGFSRCTGGQCPDSAQRGTL